MRTSVLLLAMICALSACQNAPTVACGDPSGVDTVKTLIADAAQQSAQGQAEGKSSSIRAALSRFEVEFSAVRTDKKDPDSSKVFCAAQVAVRLDPAVLLNLEAEAKAIPSVGSLDRLAEQRGFERAANVFTKRDFSYSLQPTDDGTMVFAESSDHQPSVLLSDLALLDVVRTEKAARPAVNVQSELARIQAEQAKVLAAGQQLAADQQALATLKQQQLAAAHQAAQMGTVSAHIASSLDTYTAQSSYTSLSESACKVIELDEETDGSTSICPGVGGYQLRVIDDDARVSVDVVAPDGVRYPLDLWTIASRAFSNLGPRAEWRFKGGAATPTALILRFEAYEFPDQPERKRSYLLAAKLSAGSTCLTAIIPPGPDQNIRAREAADRAPGSPCLQPSS